MSYQVLARKWRPQVFEDVVGQEHVTRTLQNAITTNRLAHAFLFSGPRGVGKTTTARILAKALNCKEGPTPTPCGVCDSCRETAAGTAVDVIEIDGASNRGIEHIRELREAVKYAPSGRKYKVYVIDEVHMLTNEAFNALLKTLEEPPPHVMFIFATTEPQKIPATIHSRCQRYGFKRIPLPVILSRLRTIAAAEGITVSDTGLAMISRAAEGSMRDSQSLLDQVVSYSGLAVKDEDLQVVLGVVPQESLKQFTQRLLAKDAAALLRQVDALLEQGQDTRQFLAGVVEHLRNMLVTKIAKDPEAIVELPAADIESIRQQAGAAETEQILMLFDSLSKTLDEMRWAPNQRFAMEVGLIKACSLAPLRPLGEVLERMRSLEERFAAPGVAAPSAGIIREQPAPYAQAKPSPPAAAASSAGDQGVPWDRIVHAVKEKKPGVGSALAHSKVLGSSEGELLVGIAGSSFQKDMAEKRESRELIEAAAAEVLGRTVRMSFQLLTDEGTHAPKAKAQKKPKPEEHDPIVQDALKIFGGRVVEPDAPEAE